MNNKIEALSHLLFLYLQFIFSYLDFFIYCVIFQNNGLSPNFSSLSFYQSVTFLKLKQGLACLRSRVKTSLHQLICLSILILLTCMKSKQVRPSYALIFHLLFIIVPSKLVNYSIRDHISIN